MKDKTLQVDDKTGPVGKSVTSAMTRKIFTLVFVKNYRSVLLGLKTRGLGKGLWNGFGGKVEKRESILDGAKRELKEECNLLASCLKQIGIVSYEEEGNPEVAIVHIFTTSRGKCAGEVVPSEEMNPVKWYNFDNLPLNEMWPDAKFWYPYMVDDLLFSAIVKYSRDGKLEEKDINKCKDLNEVYNNVKVVQ